MRSLSALGVRSVRRNRGRYLLTVVGALLGVAVLFGVLITNAGISRALEGATGSGLPGVVLDPAGAYGQPIPDSVLASAAGLADVRSAYGNVWFRGRHGGDEGEEVFVNASQLLRGPSFEAATERASQGPVPSRVVGTPPAPGADEVSIGDFWADRLGIDAGDTFTLETPTGAAELKVSKRIHGVPAGMETSLETARRLAGTPPSTFSNVYVELADGTDPATWAEVNGGALGPAVRARVGADEEGRRAVEVIQGAFVSVGLLAVFVGGFLLYLTMTMSVAERNRTWGVLRAVGTPRRAIVRAVLAEAMALGAAATVLGIVIGYLIGRALLVLAASMYGVPGATVAVTPAALLTAVAVGLIVPPIAALIPAWRAARAEPVEAMRGIHVDESRIGRGWMAGAPMLLVGLVLSVTSRRGSTDVAVLLVLFGSVLLVPPLLAPVARAAGRLTSWMAPGLGSAAVGHLVKERRRSAYTLALVMVVLAMILAIGSLQTSLLRSLDRGLRVRYGTDVSVFSFTPIPQDVRDRLRAMPGVDGATESNFGRFRLTAPAPAEGNLIVIHPESFFAMQGLPWTNGDDDRAEAGLTRGGTVLVPQVLAQQLGVEPGDRVSFETPEGAVPFEVGGVYATPETRPSMIVGAADGRRFFGADEPTAIALRAADGTSAEELRARVLDVIGSNSAYSVSTTSEVQAEAIERVRRIFRPFNAVVFMAGIVGMLGLANTLLMGIIRRTRELGVLRAIGISRRDLARMVLVEALTMAAVALVLAVGLGWVLAYAMLRSSGRALGFVVDFVPPVAMLPPLLLVTVLIGTISALAPMRKVARLDPVVALRFE